MLRRRIGTVVGLLIGALALGGVVLAAVQQEVGVSTRGGSNTSAWAPSCSPFTSADAQTEGTAPCTILDTQSALLAFNGTTWDRVRTAQTTDGGTGIGFLGVGAYGFNGTTWDRLRHSFSQSTTGINANGAGTTLSMATTPMAKFTLLVDRTAGATDVVEIDLECSLDATIFAATTATITSLAGEPVLVALATTPCVAIRYNVVTVGVGNTLTIQLLATS